MEALIQSKDFDADIQAMTERMFGNIQVQVHDYRKDARFLQWYKETTGVELLDGMPISNAVTSYEQQLWCAKHCNPTSPPAKFYCRPVSKDYIQQIRMDPNGLVTWYEGGEFRETKCDKLLEYEDVIAEAKRAQALERSNIPPLFAEKTFDNYIPSNESQKNALAVCQEMVGKRIGLFLCGPVGTGKSHLAIAVLKAHLDKRNGGFFLRTVDFLHRLRPPNNDYIMLERARETSLLVLDDLGMQKDSAWTFEKITDVIDYRNVNLLPTVITSNLTLDMMMGGGLEYQRIASRIEEGCELLLIKGDNYRRKIAINRRKER